jgi:hypothetical protein
MSFCHHLFFIPISILQASSSFIIIKIIITFLEQTIKLKYFHGYLNFSTIKFLLYFSFNFIGNLYIFLYKQSITIRFGLNFRVEDQIIKHQTRCLLPMFYLSVSIIPGYTMYYIFICVFLVFFMNHFCLPLLSPCLNEGFININNIEL